MSSLSFSLIFRRVMVELKSIKNGFSNEGFLRCLSANV